MFHLFTLWAIYNKILKQTTFVKNLIKTFKQVGSISKIFSHLNLQIDASSIIITILLYLKFNKRWHPAEAFPNGNLRNSLYFNARNLTFHLTSLFYSIKFFNGWQLYPTISLTWSFLNNFIPILIKQWIMCLIYIFLNYSFLTGGNTAQK